MKKFMKYLMVLFVCVIGISTVDAATTFTNNATAFVRENSKATNLKYSQTEADENGNWYYAAKTYKSAYLGVRFGGKEYEALCLDPSLKFPRGGVSCEPIANAASFQYMDSMRSETDYDAFQLAMRMLAVYENLNYGRSMNGVKAAIVRYMQVRNGDTEVENWLRQRYTQLGKCPGGCSKEQLLSLTLWGDDALLNKAIELADTAHGLTLGTTDPETVPTGKIRVTPGGSGRNVQLTLVAPAGSNIPEMRFECQGCSVTGSTWNMDHGTVNLTVDEGSCQYTLKMMYPGKGPYLCKQNNLNTQSLLIYVDDGEAEQVYSGEISGENCTGCCPEAIPEVIYSVNNCCNDESTSTSYAKEPFLNDLFCHDEIVKVEYYKKKCGIDYYKEMDINNYCAMYCTERVQVNTPPSNTAVSGRYFILKTNSVSGTPWAHIEGVKRCRIRIEWDKWIKNYEEQVKKQINNYNSTQKERAREKVYNSAKTKEIEDDISVSVSCSCTYYVNCATTAEPNKKCPEIDSADGYASDTVKYTIYEFSLLEQIYQKIKLDNDLHNPGNENYTAIRILHDSLPKYTHKKYSITPTELSSAQAKRDRIKSDAEADCEAGLKKCSGTATAGSYPLTAEGSDFEVEDVPSVKSQIQGNIASYTSSYNAAAEQAKIMEEELTICDDYFGEVDPNEIYPFHANADFSYSQTYLDDYGELQQDIIFVDKEPIYDEDCVITGPITGNDEDVQTPAYSDALYSKHSPLHESTIDMATTGAIALNTGTSVPYLDGEYFARKIFRHDAKFEAKCDWKDAPNTLYTLVPNGSASESTSEMNYTQHDRQYRVYLSTLDGTYETFWDVSGLGTYGKFDEEFLKRGTTCAGENAADVAMFTCKLHVEYEIVLTGYCNGVTNGIDNCDPYKEGYDLFNFKVVDPSDLFPSVSNPEDVDYGYNWLVEERGREVLGTIQETGRKDETYAIDNLTYAFELSPTDMQHIKAYNETRIQFGGYSDFELDCKKNCDISVEYGQDIGCERCHSKFLENLASGKVIYNGTDHEVIGWANSRETLGEVRNGNNW